MTLEQGMHFDVSMHDYLTMPAVSASLLKAMYTRCPRAAWFESWLNPKYEPDLSSKAQNAGSIAHCILLEGSTESVAVIDPRDYPGKKGGIPVGWTTDAIKEARDNAIAAGKIPIFPDHMVEIEAMVDAARDFLDSVKNDEPAIYAAFQPDGGQSETTIVWNEGKTLCRIRPDRISSDRKLIVDYKTGGTSAEPDQWGRTQMIRMAYYVSASFYKRGVEATFNVSPAYVYLVQQQDAPYLCSLVGVDPHAFDLGARIIDQALRQWQECEASGKWPGYPTHICYPEIPSWEDARHEGREYRERGQREYEPPSGFLLTAEELKNGIPL
jgi:hypothetical protein